MLPLSRAERISREHHHLPPVWVPEHATFFVTINCRQRGVPHLTKGETPQRLCETISHYHHSGEWFPEMVLLMPDHLHGLFTFSWKEGEGMAAMIEKWKRYTSRAYGIEWQRDYFDHRIRSETDHLNTWAYIRENPVRAGLSQNYAEWPHVWFPDHIGWPLGGRDLSPRGPAGAMGAMGKDASGQGIDGIG